VLTWSVKSGGPTGQMPFQAKGALVSAGFVFRTAFCAQKDDCDLG
jgi:hypothetical protein